LETPLQQYNGVEALILELSVLKDEKSELFLAEDDELIIELLFPADISYS
jgi:hypothetical protein